PISLIPHLDTCVDFNNQLLKVLNPTNEALSLSQSSSSLPLPKPPLLAMSFKPTLVLIIIIVMFCLSIHAASGSRHLGSVIITKKPKNDMEYSSIHAQVIGSRKLQQRDSIARPRYNQFDYSIPRMRAPVHN
ncbi:hypothetical protein LINGRAHAP2_LOCUS17064, partial [Linum grandiflorum]